MEFRRIVGYKQILTKKEQINEFVRAMKENYNGGQIWRACFNLSQLWLAEPWDDVPNCHSYDTVILYWQWNQLMTEHMLWKDWLLMSIYLYIEKNPYVLLIKHSKDQAVSMDQFTLEMKDWGKAIIASFIRSTNDSKWILCSPPGTLALETMSFPCIRNLVNSP